MLVWQLSMYPRVHFQRFSLKLWYQWLVLSSSSLACCQQVLSSACIDKEQFFVFFFDSTWCNQKHIGKDMNKTPLVVAFHALTYKSSRPMLDDMVELHNRWASFYRHHYNQNHYFFATSTFFLLFLPLLPYTEGSHWTRLAQTTQRETSLTSKVVTSCGFWSRWHPQHRRKICVCRAK